MTENMQASSVQSPKGGLCAVLPYGGVDVSEKKKAPEKELTDKEQVRKNKDEWKLENRLKTLRLVNVVALMAVFAVIAVFMTFGKRPNVSYEENRDLEKLPTFTWEDYWAGKVTDQFSKYYNDTVPMRSTWKLFIANFRDHLGIKYEGGVTIVGKLPTIEEPPKPAESTSKPQNSIPGVVTQRPSNPSGTSTSNSNNKVPDVYIPPRSSSNTSDTHEPTPAEDTAPTE